MAKPNEDVLEFSVAVDIRNSLKEMTKFQNQMARLMKEIAKSSDRTSKEQTKKSKQTKKETKATTEAVEDLTQAYEEEGKQVSSLSKVIGELEKRVRSLQGTEKDAAEAKLAFLKEEEKRRQELVDQQEKHSQKKQRKPKKAPDYGFNRKNLKKFKEELRVVGEALKEPLQSFLQRDLKGLVEGSVKGAGASLSRSLRLSRFVVGAGADALRKRGEQTSIRGKAMGGRRGAALEASGAGMKRMGDVMAKIGGMMGGLAKLGPILSSVSGFMVGLVKLFLDADASVKEFNKDIMSSAGNLSVFQRSGDDANEAAVHLQGTLNELRDAAFDYKTNLALGITKDDHKAMINTLNQEGVSLGRIEDEAEQAGKSVKELATQFTVTGVAYSRAFGVSLAEVGQFQAEMMTEMGKSVDETRKTFALLARGAEESGIASNKFFAAIRAISPDLGLFNLRLEDSVAVLSKISKVMSPRNAQKFMQESVAGLKNMGRQEKLRLSLFAGSGKTKSIVEKDIKRKTEALIKSISEKTGEKADDLRNAFEKQGYAGLKKSIDKLGPEVSGSLTESALDLQFQKSRAAKGQYGTAMAAGNLGLGGSLEIQQSALTVFSKGAYKTIGDALGDMKLDAVADALGKSEEQVEQLAKLEVAIQAQRDELKAAPGANAAAIDAMGTQDIIDSMSDDMQKSVGIEKEGQSMDQKMEALAQKQGKMTQSILDQFGVLLDWLQNEFYNVVMGIWETILDFPFVSNKAGREKIAAIRGAQAGGSAELKGVARSGDLGKGLADSNVMQSFLKALGGRGGMSADKAGAVSALVGEATKNLSPEMLASALEMDTGFRFGEDIGGRKNRTQFRENVGKYGYEEAAKRAGASPEQAVAGLGKLAYAPGGTETKFANFSRVERGLKGIGMMGAGGGAASAASTPAGKAAETTNEHLEAVADDTNKQKTLMKQQGIKIAPATIKEENKGMEDAMLSALRTALFEFYMYSGTDRGTMIASMRAGGVSDPRALAPYFSGKALETGSTTGAVAGLAAGEARANAAGGMVTGIANGMAVVAAHGEGLASIGRGERIVPAGGGGGGGVSVTVNGIGGQDLANMIQGKVVETIREYKRRERLY